MSEFQDIYSSKMEVKHNNVSVNVVSYDAIGKLFCSVSLVQTNTGSTVIFYCGFNYRFPGDASFPEELCIVNNIINMCSVTYNG